MPRTLLLLLIALALIASLGDAPPAHAYNEGGSVEASRSACTDCHAASYPFPDSKGPHGGYTSSGTKCDVCHTVHVAPVTSIKLLPKATVNGTCQTCHDGTGGKGVYNVLAQRGMSAVSKHRIDTTNVVPGGDPGTGGSASYPFSGQGGYLSCDDCHSPHDAQTVDVFVGDRARNATDTGAFSSRLLKNRPNGLSYTITKYGSDWCGACHKGRLLSSGPTHNHGVDTTAAAQYFYYERIAKVKSVSSTETTIGTLGQSNFGYVMPFPRTTEQGTHLPICQQCHEDGRNVGSPGSATTFTVFGADGVLTTDNPRFQVFPHESPNTALLVETDDNLCTNCHDPAQQLP